MLEVSGLAVKYGEAKAVGGIGLSVAAGAIVVLLSGLLVIGLAMRRRV